MYQIDVCNRQSSLPIDPDRLRQIVATVLEGESIAAAEVSLAVVGDSEMHELNRRYLQHDEPTDVLSFPLREGADSIEGEVIVSADTARRRCGEFGWQARDELALYVIHGTLHLVGYRDKTAADQARMRQQERHYLGCLGLGAPPTEDGAR